VLVFVALGVLPVLRTAAALHSRAASPEFAFDFDASFWPAGRAVLEGQSPYQDGAFVYPAPAALIFAVFALVPHTLADDLFTALTLLVVPLTLWVLGVRDWRVHGVALLWVPVVATWQSANVSTLLALGVACVWRWRDRPAVAGLTVALLVSVKFFVWPLAWWLIATRRFTPAGWAVAGALMLNLVGWAVLGFDQIGLYLRVLRALNDALGPTAYSLAAVGTAGKVLTAVAAMALAGAMWRVDERRGMILSIALALVASPLVWSHYFALLMVPLALIYPRLHPVWVLPVVMWVPAASPNAWQLALALTIAGAVFIACMWPRRPTSDLRVLDFDRAT
jgi:alpha-1,2-mannosyltransferase